MNSFGVDYNWAAAMGGYNNSNKNPSEIQGVCPDGWHLPSENEWKQLELQIGINPSIVDSDSEFRVEGWNSEAINFLLSCEDFCAYTTHFITGEGEFGYDNHGYWWSTTETSTSNALVRSISHDDPPSWWRYSRSKNFGYSVRCVKD